MRLSVFKWVCKLMIAIEISKKEIERIKIMSENLNEFFEKMQTFLPSTREEYLENVKKYGEVLETVVVEDIFMPPILALLAKNENIELLKSIFDFFEEIVKKSDPHLINVFSITVLEMLGNDKKILEIAKKYMGPQTMLLQIEVDQDLGRL